MKQPEKVKVISPEDMDKLFAHIETPSRLRSATPTRNAAILRIMQATGARAGEVLSIHSDGITYRNDGVAMLQIPSEEGCKVGARVVPLIVRNPDGSYTPAGLALERWYRLRGEGAYLFHTASGKKIHRVSFYHWVSREGRAAGIEYPVTSHMLRHTRATQLVRELPLPVVQQLLGHKKIQTTMLYTHLNENDVADALLSLQ